jgi:hypothetical protein
MSAVAWAGGAAASVAFHAALAAVLALSVRPEPVEPQTAPESRLVLAAYEVRQTDAIPAAAEGAALAPGRTEPASLSQDVIPRVAALAQAPRASPAPARAPSAAVLAPPERSDAQPLAAAVPPVVAVPPEPAHSATAAASAIPRGSCSTLEFMRFGV